MVLNVGLLGFGMSGRVFHAPLIASNPNFVLKKVLERNSNDSKKAYPLIQVVKQLEEILEDDDIDLVVIATPNNTHYDLARKASISDKHVVVDKPFTATSNQARELIEVAKSNRKVLSVFQNRRWDGDFKTIQRILNNNLLGELVDYEAHYDRWRPALRANSWKEYADTGTGVLYDLGSHLIDQAVVLFGKPISINAQIRSTREYSKIDDYFELTLNYENRNVKLKSSLLVREEGPRYILHGTKGSYVKYGLDPQEKSLNEGLTPLDPNYGVEPQDLWGILNTEVNDLHFQGKIETLPGSYQDYYSNVFEVITKGKELIVQPEHALLTIELIELAFKSNKEKRSITL